MIPKEKKLWNGSGTRGEGKKVLEKKRRVTRGKQSVNPTRGGQIQASREFRPSRKEEGTQKRSPPEKARKWTRMTLPPAVMLYPCNWTKSEKKAIPPTPRSSPKKTGKNVPARDKAF